MNQANRFNINLATAPRRNRRIYLYLLGTLLTALAAVVFLAVTFFVMYSSKGSALKARLTELDNSIRLVQREETKYGTDTQEAEKKYQAKINLVNTLIVRKAFSWIEVFSLLEASLPDSSYILSLNPALTGDSKVQLSIKVASPSIEELFTFYKNLQAQGFERITITSEMKKEGSPLISEITFDYEKRV